MATTSVPPIQFTPTGIVLPSEAEILAGVQADTNAAVGGGLSPTLSSPQGQLAQSSTAIIGSKNDEIAEIVNQVDPDNADGRWQDVLGRIYYIERIAAAGTVVNATLNGAVGTVIPAGALAQDVNGNVYSCLGAVMIPNGGVVQAQFQCQQTGPIVCAAGALNRIYKQIIGWDSITNTAAGITGNDVESRADFEQRRQDTVAGNAVNSAQSVLGAVRKVNGVIDAYVIDNPTTNTVNTGATNYPVLPTSIYVAVVGGQAVDIANAIWSKKSLGCQYNGATTYTVTDLSYPPPQPTYTVKWVSAASLPIYFIVNIKNNSQLPSNIVQLVKNAVLAVFNGQGSNQVRARIGSTIYAGSYYADVSAIDSSVQILTIFVDKTASPTVTAVTAGIDQAPTLDPANITVNLV